MNCSNPKCKTTNLPDDAKFCPNCGTLLAKEKVEIEQPLRPNVVINPYQKDVPISDKLRGILTGLMVIGGGVILLFIFVTIVAG